MIIMYNIRAIPCQMQFWTLFGAGPINGGECISIFVFVRAIVGTPFRNYQVYVRILAL